MPLDENLPTFFLAKPSKDNVHPTFFLSRAGVLEPEPSYTLRHPDSSTSKNCYSVALFDAFNPEVLYGEILLHPAWSQPPPQSQEEVRRSGGIPPPPEPLLPREFAVQLYNPDQQVHVRHGHGATLVGSPHWDFSMPTDTFRTPSASMLDRAQNDPGIASTTPRITFSWRKEKLGKDLTCYMTGKSTNVVGRKGRKEADITIAIFKAQKEITIYEPNLDRVEVEDLKGLEVVILLTAAAIREVYFGGNIRQAFNISEADRLTSTSKPVLSGSPAPLAQSPVPLPAQGSPKPNVATGSAAVSGLYTRPHANSAPIAPPAGEYYARPPPADPRTQWALDNETQQIRQQVEAEAREQRRRDVLRRRSDEEEAKRLKRMLEQEERDQREAQRLADEAETERLRRIYGDQSVPLPQAASQPYYQSPYKQQGYTMNGALQQALPPPPPHPPNSYYAGAHMHQPLPQRPGSSVGWNPDPRHSNQNGPQLNRQISSVW